MNKLIKLGIDEHLLKLDDPTKTEIEYWLYMIKTNQASPTNLNNLLKKRKELREG